MIKNAEGDAARFTSLLAEYQKAPRVTRDRLYIEAVEHVYGNSNKVILDSENSGNLMYLPLDKLMQGGGMSSGYDDRSGNNVPSSTQPAVETQAERDARERRTR